MALYNTYRWRSKGAGGRGFAVRIWQGEARSAPHAIVQAAEAYRGLLRHVQLFARAVDNDEYANDPHTLIEES